MAPPFLAHLGLDAAADERAIRRAYAQRLKQIDSQADPGGFQDLRQAYESAMHWFAAGGAQAGPDAPEADEREPQALRADARDADPRADGVPRAAQAVPDMPDAPQPHAPPESVPAPAVPWAARDEALRREAARAAEASARQAFEDLRAMLPNGPRGAHAKVLAWLRAVMDGDRLVDLDARFLFERGVVSLLANGWHPGHEYLFGPAMDCFGWRGDRGRLADFGRSGAVVAAAIDELDFYDAQPKSERIPQRDLIRRLRDGRKPRAGFLLRNLPLAEHLLRLFPHWLHLITDTGNVQRWSAWAQAIPRWRRWLAYTPPVRRPSPPKAVRTSSWSVRIGWVFMGMLVLSALLRLLSNAPGHPSVPAQAGRVPSSGAIPHLGPGSPPPQDAVALTGVAPAVHAALAAPLRPSYPPSARRLGHEGRVVVSAAIGTDGQVRNAAVDQGSGHQDLDDAALAAVRNAVFLPARDAMGLPMASRYRIPVQFKLSSDAPAPAPPSRPRSYAERVRDTFLAQVLVRDDFPGNPVAEVTLRMNAQGAIESYRLSRPSGSQAWDDAVVAAVRRVPRVPADDSGKVPPDMVLSFRPKP
ncbi:TonB family protein [Acidovorax sp. NCPPB 4044]|uniref:TonB family protein n=1 Tax=Acidovorax sp. NCPPB 4044 TaxID=2940490 RepID=UPI0023030BD7|nr:TonB family protein [Acidovorax sp. NCPPB 4044]MDA8522615.1 TonB family protein [Acidovorax sp. NCPPB 4044]